MLMKSAWLLPPNGMAKSNFGHDNGKTAKHFLNTSKDRAKVNVNRFA